MIRHLARVEHIWFREWLGGQAVEPLYDPALGQDFDFDGADPAVAAADVQRLQDEWRHADAAVTPLGLDHQVDVNGDPFSLRLAYVHVIAEYMRHNGHADMLREAIDGVTGR